MQRTFILIISLLVLTCTTIEAQTATATPQEFEFLGTMGTWIEAKRFGGQAWKPNVDDDWRPFQYGEWMPTNLGWLWASYEPFGWALYHYGSWYYDAGIGWYWIPGYEFSPAQVVWKTTDKFVGWAPKPPKGFNVIEPDEAGFERVWNVVPIKNFLQSNVNNAIVSRIPDEFRKQAKSNEPQRAAIEKTAGKPIEEIKVEKLKRGEQLVYVEVPAEIRPRILGEIEKRKNMYQAKKQ